MSRCQVILPVESIPEMVCHYLEIQVYSICGLSNHLLIAFMYFPAVLVTISMQSETIYVFPLIPQICIKSDYCNCKPH